MKYTNGPWYIDDFANDDPKYYSVGIRPPGKYRGDICHIQDCEHIDGITKEESLYNAMLISAAPELVLALKSALQTAEFERHPHRGWQDEARVAIAKAEGNQ